MGRTDRCLPWGDAKRQEDRKRLENMTYEQQLFIKGLNWSKGTKGIENFEYLKDYD